MPPPQPQRPLTDKGDTDPVTGNLQDRGTWVSGLLLQFMYTNFHHDRMPILTVLYADRRYTHAINVSYLNGNQRREFRKQLRLWYFLDPRLKYYYLKQYNSSCLFAYRTYLTYLLHPVSAWVIKELEESIPGAQSILGRINGTPTDWNKTKARATAAAKQRDITVSARAVGASQRPNVQPFRARPNARPLSIRVSEAIRGIERSQQRPTNTRPNQGRPPTQRPS